MTRPHGLQLQRIMDRLKDLDDYDLMPINGAGIPTDGTSGTGAGIAGPGCLYIDRTNAELYQNIGTLASPTWTLISNEGTTS
jgi:hypothetical protein